MLEELKLWKNKEVGVIFTSPFNEKTSISSIGILTIKDDLYEVKSKLGLATFREKDIKNIFHLSGGKILISIQFGVR